ncbi:MULTISPECIES: GspH/FimT family pseudopilin [Luteimonas]|uniref:GspH/FimT family pseudopilin n=1 Tax=Luteimonas TaxID=83614 RepID=UPI000C7D08D4|nr:MULTISPECIES: GspH/FimT family pseudopilin [Luteimonas]
MWQMQGRRPHPGFTLVESLIVLAITALLLTVAYPSFQGTVARLRTQTAMHLVSADLAMARNTAIMRRAEVVVCPRTDTNRCRDDVDWGNGWIVFADADRNRQPDLPEDLLRVADAPAAAGGALRLAATRKFIRYKRDGRAAGTNLTVRVCTGDQLRGEVAVNNLGRVRSRRHEAGSACPM